MLGPGLSSPLGGYIAPAYTKNHKHLKNIADIKDSNGNACLFNGMNILERARFLLSGGKHGYSSDSK
jgi:hypothetical protein